MSNIVAFRLDRQYRRKPAPAGAGAQLLFFTGVRYERHAVVVESETNKRRSRRSPKNADPKGSHERRA